MRTFMLTLITLATGCAGETTHHTPRTAADTETCATQVCVAWAPDEAGRILCTDLECVDSALPWEAEAADCAEDAVEGDGCPDLNDGFEWVEETPTPRARDLRPRMPGDFAEAPPPRVEEAPNVPRARDLQPRTPTEAIYSGASNAEGGGATEETAPAETEDAWPDAEERNDGDRPDPDAEEAGDGDRPDPSDPAEPTDPADPNDPTNTDQDGAEAT